MVENQSASALWRPSASIASLHQRADYLAQIRTFFASRNVCEVTTPVLAAGATTDPHVESFHCQDRWLQTSPEFHMKRLLAAGSGPIYQIGPAFRLEEQGHWHNPEFQLLEWYRPGFDEHALMDELAALWSTLSGGQTELRRYSYAQLIEQHLGLDWNQVSIESLRPRLQAELGELPPELDLDGLLDAAMGLLIGPKLGQGCPCFVFNYPSSQAALARVSHDAYGHSWARRFEMYWKGLELANGFFELCDAAEQAARFEADLRHRRAYDQVRPPMDLALIEALKHGLPDCSGVALGLDRLFALLMEHPDVASVMSFSDDRA